MCLTRAVTQLYARCRPPSSHLPLLEFSECFVEAAMDIVESWFTKLLQNALKCAVHRGSTMLTAADIELARSILHDTTMPHARELDVSQGRRSGYSERRFSLDVLPGIPVEVKDRIIRTFVRRVQGLAFNARAYELIWVLLLARLCKLLTRVGELVLYREDPPNDPDLATKRTWMETWPGFGCDPDASRQLVLKPRLADLAYALKEDPNAPCYSWAEAWGEIDAENASDDDNSSIRSSDLPPDSDLDW